MKQSPSEANLRSRLGPSKFSSDGFLGSDTRPVDEIVAEDLKALEQAGVTKEELVAALRDAYDRARDAMGAEVTVREGVTAVFFESMGRIPSPFRGDGVFPKGEAVVTDTVSGATVRLTAVSISLIEKHGFFQGIGARYRIEPHTAIGMLLKRNTG
jgi:hypothetical protein